METTFYLNNNTIYFCLNYNKNKIRKSTLKKIKASDWGKGFPKQKKSTKELRDTLTLYKNKLDSYIIEVIEAKKRPPTSLEVSEFLKVLLGTNNKSDSVNDLIDYYLGYSERHFANKTKQTKKIHLTDFKKHTKSLEINDLNKKVFTQYLNKLIDKYIETETINTYIKDIKACFSFLYEHEKIDIDYSHNRFIKKYPSKPKPIIALTENELQILESYTLESTRLQKVIDLFLFGCYTALRFEDLNSFKIEDKEGARQISINKTGQIINIPIITEAQRILEKYNYNLPRISNQKANEYLKQAFKIYGLDRLVNVNKNYVNRIDSETVKLHDTITFHKSRKTFITTALRRGINKRIVMQLADIKTDSVFKRYSDYENKEGQNAMNELFSKGTKEPLTFHQHLREQFNKVKGELEDSALEMNIAFEDLNHNLKKASKDLRDIEDNI